MEKIFTIHVVEGSCPSYTKFFYKILRKELWKVKDFKYTYENFHCPGGY